TVWRARDAAADAIVSSYVQNCLGSLLPRKSPLRPFFFVPNSFASRLVMADVKYRVIGVREDGQHVPISAYLTLEAIEKIATAAQTDPTFTRIIIESGEEAVRRARV